MDLPFLLAFLHTQDIITRMSIKITIIGGGICGLSIGWYLARAKNPTYDVTIIERNQAGRAASWAAGGMLAPDIETEAGEQKLSKLLFRARELWPQFGADLERAASANIHFQKNGSLYVARDADDVEKLKFLFSLEQDYGLSPEWLSGYEARKIEPHLSRNIIAAIHHPHDAMVDNRAVVDALITAFQSSGGKLIEHRAIDRVVVENNRCQGVMMGNEVIKSDITILATGAWAAEMPGLPQFAIPPVRPVKGQMIAIKTHPTLKPSQKLIWSPDVYLIPQPNRLLIGATVEEIGFNPDITFGAQMDLLNEAFALLPSLYDMPIVESWAGHRPTSRDDAPILGASGVDGLLLATGHHRNGILLAPLTAMAIFDLVHNGACAPAIQDFTIARFAA